MLRGLFLFFFLQIINKFGSFLADGQPGEGWITLNGLFSNEDIKVDVTMFDGDVMDLHITLIVIISKGDNGVLQTMYSAWPDSIEIKKLFISADKNMPSEPYAGAEFE